jgi:hypothetical protein
MAHPHCEPCVQACRVCSNGHARSTYGAESDTNTGTSQLSNVVEQANKPPSLVKSSNTVKCCNDNMVNHNSSV